MRLLVLGGTSTARRVAEHLLALGHAVTVSVTRTWGLATIPPGANVLLGARDRTEWIELLSHRKSHGEEGGVEGIVDCSHPFATAATEELAAAAAEQELPFVVFERTMCSAEESEEKELFPPRFLLRANSPEEGCALLWGATRPGDCLFLAVGVKLLPRIVPLLRKENRRVVARVLPTEESLCEARRAGLEPKEIVALWGAGSVHLNEALLLETGAAGMLSKDSGEEGGLRNKIEACRNLGLPLVLLNRPSTTMEHVPSVSSLEELETVLTSWEKKKTGSLPEKRRYPHSSA
jgi:precorrin-6x reductase